MLVFGVFQHLLHYLIHHTHTHIRACLLTSTQGFLFSSCRLIPFHIALRGESLGSLWRVPSATKGVIVGICPYGVHGAKVEAVNQNKASFRATDKDVRSLQLTKTVMDQLTWSDRRRSFSLSCCYVHTLRYCTMRKWLLLAASDETFSNARIHWWCKLCKTFPGFKTRSELHQ